MDANLYNGLALAYIGDAVYEVFIRNKIMATTSLTKVNDLHKEVIKYTSGEGQAKAVAGLLNNNMLTDEEMAIYKRGRNVHVKSNRKNIDIQTYLMGTGFEALVGFLYLSENTARLQEIMEYAFDLGKE